MDRARRTLRFFRPGFMSSSSLKAVLGPSSADRASCEVVVLDLLLDSDGILFLGERLPAYSVKELYLDHLALGGGGKYTKRSPVSSFSSNDPTDTVSILLSSVWSTVEVISLPEFEIFPDAISHLSLPRLRSVYLHRQPASRMVPLVKSFLFQSRSRELVFTLHEATDLARFFDELPASRCTFHVPTTTTIPVCELTKFGVMPHVVPYDNDLASSECPNTDGWVVSPAFGHHRTGPLNINSSALGTEDAEVLDYFCSRADRDLEAL